MPFSATDRVFRFSGFALDIDRGTIARDEKQIFLRPKTYTLLTHLARNMGRVVPKQELMETVWPGVFVTEDSLTQAVREIRKTLGGDLVRTISRRGYMLAAEPSGPKARARGRFWQSFAFATTAATRKTT